MNGFKKSQDNQMVFGVLGGLAEYYGLDPVLVRVIFIVSCFLNGIPVLFYLVLAIVLPEGESSPREPYERKHTRREDNYNRKNRSKEQEDYDEATNDDADWSDF